MSLETYLFDLDGTLLDMSLYKTIYPTIMQKLQEQYNISQEELDRKIERTGLTRNNGRWDTGEVCKKSDNLDLYYAILKEQISLTNYFYHEALVCITNLKNQGKRIGIASNSMRRTISLHLTHCRFTEMIDFLYSSDDAGAYKVQEIYWKNLVKTHKITPEKTLMIGDSLEDDIYVPRRMGFDTFHLKHKEELLDIMNLETRFK